MIPPIRAIRRKCLDCSNNQTKEVTLCELENCALWRYRMGRRPEPCKVACSEKTGH